MNILFIGCVQSSYQLLECLLQHGFSVTGIITMEDSNINSDFQSLIPLAKAYEIEYICTKNANNEETIKFVKSRNPEVIYCFGWSRLIGKELLDIPSRGVVGFHPAALPANRGRHPLIWTLALGLKKTASTFFLMDEGADTGDIINQKEIEVFDSDDAQSLYNKVLDTAKKQILELTKQLEKGMLERIPQNKLKGNTWRKRGEMDGQIDWRMSAIGIYNLVRALTRPYVGAHFIYKNKKIKIWKCECIALHEYKNIEPGKVLHVNSSNDYFIKAYDGVIHVFDCDKVNLTEGEYL